ncbi:MAG: c-type cytochrome [Elusimicrobia bacterium]|nr:c-type cytochrome [Elusimicrobiota bacterium]
MRIEDYASPEELKRLGTVFMTVLVGLCVVALFEFIVVPSLRIANRPPSGADIPQQGATGWLDPTEYPAVRGYVVPPVDPKTVLTASPELVQRGQELYAKNCVQCHGPDGLGDGASALTMDPRPRNFSQAAGWKNGSGLVGIFKTLAGGIPGGGMAAFDFIRAKDRMALAHFVQSKAMFQRPPEDAAALAALAKTFASAGEVVSNKIPVSLAMKKLVEEYSAPKPLVFSGVTARVVTDPERAAVWLRNSTAWRGGPKALAEAVMAQAPGNGFAVESAGLSPAEWGSLFSEVRRTF